MHAIDKIFSLVPGYTDYIRRKEVKSADLGLRIYCAKKITNKIKTIRKSLKIIHGVNFSKEFTTALALLSSIDAKSEGLKSMVAGGGTFFEPNLVSDDDLKAVLKEDRKFIALTTEFEEISHDAFEDISRLMGILLDFEERLEKIIEIRKLFFEN
jgi:hypothetical protein